MNNSLYSNFKIKCCPKKNFEKNICFISGQKHLQVVNILNGCRCGKKWFCLLHLQITGEGGNQGTDKYLGVILACTAWPESGTWEEDLCAGFCSLPDGLASKERERGGETERRLYNHPASDCTDLSNQLPLHAASCYPGNNQACSCPAKERGSTLRN